VHAIVDTSAVTFLEELAETVHHHADQLGRRVHVIAESDLNDARLIRPKVLGGFGLDAMWSDDFHHALHTLLTGERDGYYRDFGTLQLMSDSLRQGYAYTGRYSAYRRRRHGNLPRDCSARQFVVFAQNHDQVGNRALGERLAGLVSFSDLKLAAGMVLLSPFVPLIFMGEEYGETAPFQYFTSHSDPDLIEAVRKGRREEFAGFQWADDVPDPQAEATFLRSRLNHELRTHGRHAVLLKLHQELIRLRREIPALSQPSQEYCETFYSEVKKILFTVRRRDDNAACAVFSFAGETAEVTLPFPPGEWEKVLDSAAECWLGDGRAGADLIKSAGDVSLIVPPKWFALYTRVEEA
jgi:maltooligosyltrehalose trehalohydrolase